MPIWIDYITDTDDDRVLCPTCGSEDACEHCCDVCENFDHGTADHDDDTDADASVICWLGLCEEGCPICGGDSAAWWGIDCITDDDDHSGPWSLAGGGWLA